jgi:Mce-associated membrane protein
MAEHADATRKVTEVDHPSCRSDDPAATNDVAAQEDTETQGRSARSTTSVGNTSTPDGTDAESEAGADAEGGGDPVTDTARTRLTPIRLAAIFGIATMVALIPLAGWLGHCAYDAHRAQQQRELFLEVGRQGAVNLTTIDWQHADADAQRILNASTGRFHDEFAARSKSFVDVVKQAKSTSVGTVTEAGVESESADQAQLLVAVTVQETNAGAAQQQPRGWRMRVTVQKVGNDVKVANVGFVP